MHQTGPMQIAHSDGSVSAVTRGKGPIGVLLAHGAGAGIDHPWMVSMGSNLADRGLRVLAFNYAYIESGRRSPDRMPRLLEVHRAAADALADECERVVLAGKSMGGRVGAHLAGDEGWPAAAAVYYGYPLVPIGKTEPRPVDHLRRIAAPQLFFAGTRDRMGKPALIEEVAATLPDATVVVVEGGDHSFNVPKSSGSTTERVLDEIASATADWIAGALS